MADVLIEFINNLGEPLDNLFYLPKMGFVRLRPRRHSDKSASIIFIRVK
jgi:hypothetical protein